MRRRRPGPARACRRAGSSRGRAAAPRYLRGALLAAGLGERAATRPTSSCARRPARAPSGWRRSQRRTGCALAVVERPRHAAAYARGRERDRRAARPRRRARRRARAGGDRRSSERLARGRTGSRTPTTRTSSARAARRRTSSRPSAGWRRGGALDDAPAGPARDRRAPRSLSDPLAPRARRAVRPGRPTKATVHRRLKRLERLASE